MNGVGQVHLDVTADSMFVDDQCLLIPVFTDPSSRNNHPGMQDPDVTLCGRQAGNHGNAFWSILLALFSEFVSLHLSLYFTLLNFCVPRDLFLSHVQLPTEAILLSIYGTP